MLLIIDLFPKKKNVLLTSSVVVNTCFVYWAILFLKHKQFISLEIDMNNLLIYCNTISIIRDWRFY